MKKPHIASVCCLFSCLFLSEFLCGQQFRGYWKAVSTTAMGVTGDIQLSSDKLGLNFHNYLIADIRRLTPDEVLALFSGEGTDAPSTSELYKVTIPASVKLLHKNNLCGTDDVQWMVLDQSGNSLAIAFFSGASAPVFTVDAINKSTSLCGTYTYAR